jgi:proline dehydrogenase
VDSLDSRVTSQLYALWEPLARRAGRAYVAGPDLSSARRLCRALGYAQIGTIVGYWNAEGVGPGNVAAEQLRATTVLAEDGRDVILSIKAPALGFSSTRIKAIASRAADLGVPLHFDAQRLDTVERTWPLVEEARAIHEKVGCTLPGRFLRSAQDADRAANLGLRVRVVKGQMADPKAPNRDARAGFLEVADALAGKARLVGIASHDAPLVRDALARLLRAGTPCELEVLLGLPLGPILAVARDYGVPVRMYIPYGNPRLPYHLSHARHSPEILTWLLRDLARRPEDDLAAFRRT